VQCAPYEKRVTFGLGMGEGSRPGSRTESPSLPSTPDHSALPGASLLAAYPRALAAATEKRPRARLAQSQQPVHCSWCTPAATRIPRRGTRQACRGLVWLVALLLALRGGEPFLVSRPLSPGPRRQRQEKARFCHLARHTRRMMVRTLRQVLARRNRTVHGTNVGGSQDSCACLSCLEQRSLDRGKLREGGQPGSAKSAT